MKRILERNDTRLAGGSTRKFERAFHRFSAGVAKSHLIDRRQSRGQKFGVPYDDAAHVALRAARLPHLRLIGLDMHLGSQLATVEPYLDGTTRLTALVAGLRREGVDTLELLDIGGGLGVRYDTEQPADLDGFAESLVPLVRDTGLTLLMEPGRFIVGADQTLALGERLFSKPAGRPAAAEQLRLLAGKRHELHSAFAVARDGTILSADVSVAGMTMRPLSEGEIEAYLDQAGEAVTTSVGAYQLEGLGVHLFTRIEGDHFTILGLPLLPLLAFLRGEQLFAV